MGNTGYNLKAKGSGFILTVTGGNGSTTIQITSRGALRDLSGAPIDAGDVRIAVGALRAAGETDLAAYVQAWWETKGL